MKKTYEAPKLTNHGTVAQMTNFFGKGDGDTLIGPGPNDDTGNPGGSIDACATFDQGNCFGKDN